MALRGNGRISPIKCVTQLIASCNNCSLQDRSALVNGTTTQRSLVGVDVEKEAYSSWFSGVAAIGHFVAKTHFPAHCEFAQTQISLPQRKSGMTGRGAASRRRAKSPQRAVPDGNCAAQSVDAAFSQMAAKSPFCRMLHIKPMPAILSVIECAPQLFWMKVASLAHKTQNDRDPADFCLKATFAKAIAAGRRRSLGNQQLLSYPCDRFL